ncbi:MAG TPA: hypothetical protein VIH89_13955 [Candidatus Sulfotelmatobacter sp.]|jgi:hypothetical protein
MKPRFVALLGFGTMILAFTVGLYLELVALFLSAVVCSAVATGFLWQGHKARAFWIMTGRKAGTGDTRKSDLLRLRIEGREFCTQDLPSRLHFKIATRNMHMLAAIGIIATGSIVAVLSSPISPFEPVVPGSERHFLYYGLCYLMGILTIPSFAWFSECALIRRSSITLATVHGQGEGKRGTLWVRYHFVDPTGGYHGGSVVNLGGPKHDQLKIVLCHSINPDVNKISSGFLFHKISWQK